MFKEPLSIPQDLLLIQGLVTESEALDVHTKEEKEKSSQDDSIASSDSDIDSEIEIEQKLVQVVKEEPNVDSEALNSPVLAPICSPLESSDSDTDSDSEEENCTQLARGNHVMDEDEDDESGGPFITSSTQVRTKNEVPDLSIVVPEITEVGPEELLEKIGEVMSIFDNIVIVKGLASQTVDRAAESALDSDSLLVFEDRKVLGYVYETFGPTHQPLYQIKFTPSFPLNKDITKIARDVYHVPRRSRFVFPSQLKRLKGSDASNIHDEEVGDNEIEFSDDEAEAEYKRGLKERRQGSRAGSVVSSRFSTPTPSAMHDQDLIEDAYYGASQYDDNGLYDMDTGPGPSRPAPMPYDDPYQEYAPPLSPEPLLSSQRKASKSSISINNGTHGYDAVDAKRRARGRGRGRNAGNSTRLENSHGRGRGREQGRGRGGGRGTSSELAPSENGGRQQHPSAYGQYDPPTHRPLSPTSLAIARATGQYHDGSSYSLDGPVSSRYLGQTPEAEWRQMHYQPDATTQNAYGPPYQQYVQPHINPRFASFFGIDMSLAQVQNPHYGQYTQSGTVLNGSTGRSSNSHSNGDEYAVHLQPHEEYRP